VLRHYHASGKVTFRPSYRRILNTKSKSTPITIRFANLSTYNNCTNQRSFEEFPENRRRKSASLVLTTLKTVDTAQTKNSSDEISNKIRRRTRPQTAIGGGQTEERAANDCQNAVAMKTESFSYLNGAVHSDLIFCLSSYRRR